MNRFARVDTLVTFTAVAVTAIMIVRIAASGGPWSTAVVLCLQCAAVLLRHRQPTLTWAVTVVGLVSVGQGEPSWVAAGALCQLSLLHLVSVASRWVKVTAAVLTGLALYIPLVLRSPAGLLDPDSAGLLAWTVGAVAVGHALRSRRDYVLAVEDRAHRAEVTREALARWQVVEERMRIARELHDVVGHHLAVITVHAGLARRTLRSDPDSSEAALVETETAARSVLREMAGILRLLRSDHAPDTIEGTPLPGLERVGELVDAVVSGGVEVAAEVDDVVGVPDLVSLTGYRVVQEALTNAVRHGTGRVELTVRVRAHDVVVEVTNPVSGGPPGESDGYGLTGMRERVDAIGGRLHVDWDARWFRVHAALPLEPGRDGKG